MLQISNLTVVNYDAPVRLAFFDPGNAYGIAARFMIAYLSCLRGPLHLNRRAATLGRRN
jgi:hypothetical protein